jgi:hypothetical protein
MAGWRESRNGCSDGGSDRIARNDAMRWASRRNEMIIAKMLGGDADGCRWLVEDVV